jgi:hypothetical protein
MSVGKPRWNASTKPLTSDELATLNSMPLAHKRKNFMAKRERKGTPFHCPKMGHWHLIQLFIDHLKRLRSCSYDGAGPKEAFK